MDASGKALGHEQVGYHRQAGAWRSPPIVLILLLACTTTLALGTALPGAATASPLDGSSYDSGDGDQDDGATFDWQRAESVGVAEENDPPENLSPTDKHPDVCFKGGTKETEPGQWAFGSTNGGCVPPKSNLFVTWAHSEFTTETTFFHGALFREANTGDTFLGIELNSSGVSWTNARGETIPCRSDGDLLVSYEIGGSSVEVVLYSWSGTGPGACPDGESGSFASSGVLSAPLSQGAVNAPQITNYLNPGVWGSSFDARTFGELSLNLPDAMPSVGEDPCFNYVRMHTHTRASEAIDSQLIDSLRPIPVRVQSCSAQGTTFDDANGNGEHENGEPGLEGVEVFVDYDDDEKPDPDEPVGVSDEEGEWGVAPVETPGTFDVILDPPGDVQCSDPNACEEERTFPADGSNEVGVTFTAFETATASGELFEDSNGDGDEDPSEEGLDGWTVFADDDKDGSADQDEPSDTTDERGDYEISDITPGSYTIRPELPQTWECTRPGQCKYDEKVSSGDELTGLDFAVSKKGKGPSDGGDDGGGADGGGEGGGGGPTGGGGVSGGDAGTAGSLPLTGLGLGLLGLTGLLLLGCGLGAGRMLTRR